MRRFEKDGRFWQISLEGRSVTTRSGAGTGTGRASRKTFSTVGLALTEIDKRIAKRMTEPGWCEVLPRFTGEVDLTPRIEGLDPERVARRQRAPGTLAVDAVVAAAAVARRLDMARDRFAKGFESGTGGPGGSALKRVLEQGLEALTDDMVAVAVLLTVVPEADTADLLVARFGLVATVRAIAMGPRYVVQRDLRTARVVDGEPKTPRVRAAVSRVRDLLLQATDADVATCEGLARAAMGPKLPRTLELVTLFPATDWVDAFLLERGLTMDTLLVASAASPEAFARLVAKRPTNRHTTPERLLPHLEVLMQRHGADAAPALVAVARALGAEGVALRARLRTSETVDELVSLLDDPTLGSAARAALIAMGDLTLATLASKRRLKKAAAALAEELAQQAGLGEALLPHLDERTAARVRAWVGEDAGLPVTDDVPAALRGPAGRPLEPWIRLPSLPALRTPEGTHTYPPAASAHALSRLSDTDGPVEMGDDDPMAAVAEDLRSVCHADSLDGVLAGVLTAWSEGVAEGLYGTSPWSLIGEDRDDDGWEEQQGTRRPRWVRDAKAPEEMHRPWVLSAVAQMGGEACGRALFRCILDWGRKGGRYPELLSQAVDVLCGLPGDETLVHLGALARRVPKAKLRIEMYLARAARERGVDPTHLDEMLLPTLGLDARGQRELDFGRRTFTVGFDPRLEPTVIGPDGRGRRTLPKPTKDDDKALVKQARATWTDLKKQVRALRTTLLSRLETAMRTQRPYRGDHFLRYLARHPLARHPVSALVWTTGDTRFRIDAKGDPVGQGGKVVALDAPIHLVHPLELDEAERTAWTGIFAERALVQPFAQLDRDTYGPSGVGELAGRAIPRARLFALRNRGWAWEFSSLIDNVPYDKPMLHALVMTLQGAKVSLLAATPVDLKEHEELLVGRVMLVDGTWDALPQVAVSEIARDLQRATRTE